MRDGERNQSLCPFSDDSSGVCDVKDGYVQKFAALRKIFSDSGPCDSKSREGECSTSSVSPVLRKDIDSGNEEWTSVKIALNLEVFIARFLNQLLKKVPSKRSIGTYSFRDIEIAMSVAKNVIMKEKPSSVVSLVDEKKNVSSFFRKKVCWR